MRKISLEGIGYYLSCMMLFNLIYAIKMVMDGLFVASNINWKLWTYCVDFTTFCISAALFIVGCFFTIAIIKKDNSITSKNTKGREVTVSELEDLTGENYFTNYSLLVLTGLSLPTTQNVLSFLLYLLVLVTLGSVYIKKDLIYMNPAMTILNFSIYRCKDLTSKNSYVFVVKDANLEDGDIISYQNISKKIIRINGSNSVKKVKK